MDNIIDDPLEFFWERKLCRIRTACLYSGLHDSSRAVQITGRFGLPTFGLVKVYCLYYIFREKIFFGMLSFIFKYWKHHLQIIELYYKFFWSKEFEKTIFFSLYYSIFHLLKGLMPFHNLQLPPWNPPLQFLLWIQHHWKRLYITRGIKPLKTL